MIDFDEIRQRLAYADKMLSGDARDDEEVASVLKKRTEELARRRQAGKEEERLTEVTVVKRGDALFGIPTDNVVEVRKISLVTIPGGNQTVQGVFQVRGRLYSLIDLQGMLGGSDAPLANNDSTFAVVVEGASGRVGLRIDEPVGPQTIFKKDIDEELSSQKSPFVSAVTRDLVALLDVNTLLGRNEIVL